MSTSIPAPLRTLLLQAVEQEASDLHLAPGYAATVRVHGTLTAINNEPLDAATLTGWLREACSAQQWAEFESAYDADFSLELESGVQLRRFRVNYFFSTGHCGACFRLIPETIPSLDWAEFPGALATRLTGFRNGLVLVTGVTGSGKTTTLAMLVDRLCREGGHRVITVEDPIEYVFPVDTGSVITQREVGRDVNTFSQGLKHGLRQDPDIILVGEIRDRETAQMTLTAAETGHLVFSTMHTRDARGAITRYTDLFPQGVQQDIRSQLAMSLRSVVSQHLLPTAESDGKRALALEVLFNTLPVASGIRQGKVETIDNSIMTGKADGMISIDESLTLLTKAGRITPEIARRFAKHSY
jgi:twitching motility protein PilT